MFELCFLKGMRTRDSNSRRRGSVFTYSGEVLPLIKASWMDADKGRKQQPHAYLQPGCSPSVVESYPAVAAAAATAAAHKI